MRRHAFWAGSLAVCAGVALHVPDYVMARHDHFMMAGMPMSRRMWTGMALIAAGLALNDNTMLLAGAIPAAVLALLTQLLFDLAEHACRRAQSRVQSRPAAADASGS